MNVGTLDELIKNKMLQFPESSLIRHPVQQTSETRFIIKKASQDQGAHSESTSRHRPKVSYNSASRIDPYTTFKSRN